MIGIFFVHVILAGCEAVIVDAPGGVAHGFCTVQKTYFLHGGATWDWLSYREQIPLSAAFTTIYVCT